MAPAQSVIAFHPPQTQAQHLPPAILPEMAFQTVGFAGLPGTTQTLSNDAKKEKGKENLNKKIQPLAPLPVKGRY
jgi:hypothetical protein